MLQYGPAFNITGRINVKMLSPRTYYTTHLVSGLSKTPLFKAMISLNFSIATIRTQGLFVAITKARQLASKRVFQPLIGKTNEWIEVELGEFYINGGEEGEIEVCLIIG